MDTFVDCGFSNNRIFIYREIIPNHSIRGLELHVPRLYGWNKSNVHTWKKATHNAAFQGRRTHTTQLLEEEGHT